MPELVGGNANVGPHRFPHQCLVVVSEIRCEQCLHRRANAIDDRAEIPRLVLRFLAEFLERGQNDSTLRVTEYDDQPRLEPVGGELHAADLGLGDDVAGHPDHEQVAESLLEDDLGGNSRVGASENDGERLLAAYQPPAPRAAGKRVAASHVGYEATVSVAQALERFCCRDHSTPHPVSLVGSIAKSPEEGVRAQGRLRIAARSGSVRSRGHLRCRTIERLALWWRGQHF